ARACTSRGGSSFLSFLWRWSLVHAIEMALERVDMRGPEAAEPSEPFVNFHEGLRSNAVEASLRIDARLDESGLPKHAQMFGDRGLRHSKPLLDLLHGPLRGREQAQDGPTVRLGDDGEGGFHGTYILVSVYTCQAIFVA